jgi:hypothetical protein
LQQPKEACSLQRGILTLLLFTLLKINIYHFYWHTFTKATPVKAIHNDIAINSKGVAAVAEQLITESSK